jgi:hypothetical protein
MVRLFFLSAPQSLKDQIHETLCSNKNFGNWNGDLMMLKYLVDLHELLGWIEASGWNMHQMSFDHGAHAFIFKKN